MKLTFYEIQYHLIKKYNARRISCNPVKITVGRPVYYQEGRDSSGHAVLIENRELMSLEGDSPLWKDCIFLCFGEVHDMFCRMDTDLLVLDENLCREEVLNDLQDIFQCFEEVEQSLLEVFLENGDFKELMCCFEPVLETPVALIDGNFSYVAYSDREDRFRKNFMNESNSLPLPLAGQLITDVSFGRSIALKGLYSYTLEQVNFLCKNLFYDGGFIGKLIAMSSTSPLDNEYHRDLLVTMSDYVERLYVRYGSFHMAEHSLDTLHKLMEIKLKGEPCPESRWRQALEDVLWKEEDVFSLIQMRPGYVHEKSLYETYLRPEIERQWKGTCCVIYDNSLVVLLNETRLPMESMEPGLAYFLRENLLTAGISRKLTGGGNLQAAMRQTDIAFEFGMKKDSTRWCFRFDDYALDCLVLYGRSGFDLEEICAPALLILREHDVRVHTEYYKTLFCYCRNRYNAAAAAKELFIHRTTFLNRLDRITELTGIDLDSFPGRLYLEASFYLAEEERV